MTREERLDWLCRLRSGLVWFDVPPKERPVFEQVLSEVIKALEQEPILDKIYADIQKLRGCSCSCSDGIIDDVEDILDKYKAEMESEE